MFSFNKDFPKSLRTPSETHIPSLVSAEFSRDDAAPIPCTRRSREAEHLFPIGAYTKTFGQHIHMCLATQDNTNSALR